MAEDLVPLALAISPSGAVHLDARPSLEGCAPAALARELTSDLAHGPGFAILQLAARHPGETLPPSVAFFREVGALFLARACASPEPASVQAPADELARLVSQAPPMCGGEYLRPSTLEALWSDLDAALRSELRETSLEQWFKDRLDAVVHVDQPVPPLVVEGVPAHVHLSDEAVEVGHPVRV